MQSNIRRWVALLLLVLGGLLTTTAQARVAKLSNEHATRYQRLDLTFDLVAHWTDPADPDDIRVDVMTTTPDGGRLVVPAYLVAGSSDARSTWRASLSPAEAGAYRYEVVAVDQGRALRTDLSGWFKVGKGMGQAKGFLHVHDDWTLQFDDGELFRGVGENLAWESRDVDDSRYFKSLNEDRRFNYENMLRKLGESGGNFARVWMIYWNLPLEWQWVDNNRRYRPTHSRFNESGIQRMDELLATAERNHVYLMVALDSHVGLMGDGWEHSPYNKKNGGSAATPAEFFSSAAAKKQYKEKLRYLVARWGFSTHIAAWEFFNEVDNAIYADKDHPIPDQLVTQWHREMSDYLKEIDPFKHIVTTSISHREVAGLYDLPNIAINQRHVYKALESIPETLQQASVKHGKPFVIGEAAYEWDWSKNFDDVSAGMRDHFKRQLWYGLFNPTPVLPMSWWWEYFDEKGMTPYFKGVQDINQRMLRASEGRLRPISVTPSDPTLTHFAVGAGRTTFVYLHNPGGAPVTTTLGLAEVPPGSARIEAYDPERQTSSAYSGSLDAVKVGAGEDLILIVTPTM